jgi:YidC/Oxa1 family membrane protein insertase
MDKRDFPLAVACVLVLVWYMLRIAPATQPEPGPGTETQDPSITVTEDTTPPNGEAPAPPAPTTDVDEPEASPPKPAGPEIAAGFANLAAAGLKDLGRGDVYSLKLDPEAGGIREVTLFQHRNEARDGPMKLGSLLHPMYTVQSGDDEWRFTHAKVVDDTPGTFSIERGIIGTPLVLRQAWRLPEDSESYRLSYTVTVRNPGDRLYHTKTMRFNCGVLGGLDTAKGFFGAGGMDQRVDIVESGDEDPDWYVLQKVQKLKEKKRKELADMPIDWIAVQNKYFASIIVPKTEFKGVDMEVVEGANEEDGDLIQATGLAERAAIAPGESATWEFDCYLGAKNFEQLKDMGQNQEKIMQFDLFIFFHVDWMVVISHFIKKMLMIFSSLLHNYGVAIILLTLLVRTCFWPVTHRTTVWSRQMQALAPEMKEIREKYKDNPQVIQEKTFALYREHKINPVMGCLPVLLQVPVFFALFNVLRNAIELRQQGFLWVYDLSQPDTIFELFGLPINPLALGMGITMFLQQSMVPTSADPMQQRMMKFMSFGIVFICYTLPSGLTLYWTTSNVISIFQYRITHGKDDNDKKKTTAAQDESSDDAGGKRKKKKPGGKNASS